MRRRRLAHAFMNLDTTFHLAQIFLAFGTCPCPMLPYPCVMLTRAIRLSSTPFKAAFSVIPGPSTPLSRHQTYQRYIMAASTAKSLDHIVLTVEDISATIKWYEEMLNMSHTSFTSGGVERHALKFGDQKINLHQSGKEFEPKAKTVQPGSGDLCFLVQEKVDDVLARLQDKRIDVLEGGKVVDRTGARGKLVSPFLRLISEN